MADVTCPHCGFIFQVEESKQEKPKKPISKAKAEKVMVFIEAWNAFAKEKNLPLVRESNETVRAKILTRCSEKGFAEDFLDALNLIAMKSFYRGLNDTKWTANLEYLLRPGKSEELAQKYRAEIQHGSKPTTYSPGTSRLLSRTRGDGALQQEPEAGG